MFRVFLAFTPENTLEYFVNFVAENPARRIDKEKGIHYAIDNGIYGLIRIPGIICGNV